MDASTFLRRVATSITQQALLKNSSWFDPHMVAASRAIAERVPLVDIILEIRDARIPLSSENMQLKHFPILTRRIIVFNKADLANHEQTRLWMKHFEKHGWTTCCVNSHNKRNVKELLNFVERKSREMRKDNYLTEAVSVLVTGIPNVGKSALVNSLHNIGRVTAEVMGKLRHATVSPLPGETMDICAFKVGPSMYVLDTPGVLPPRIVDAEVFMKLALTGAIRDCVVSDTELARCFLFIFNSSGPWKQWSPLTDGAALSPAKGQFASDHTQDFVVHDVRKALYEMVCDVECMEGVIESQLSALHGALRVSGNPSDADALSKVAVKLLNLFRTGRLGHYIIDPLPSN